MIIDKQTFEKELEQWEKYFSNYDNLAVGVLADVLAHYKKEDREDLIKKVEDAISAVQEPIDGNIMYESLKADIDSFERINQEAKIAYRTLKWIEEIQEKSETNEDSKDSEE